MRLDPLPSERFRIITESYERTKPLEASVFGVTGAWIALNSIGKGTDAYHLNNLFSGASLLATAGIDLVSPSSYRTDLNILNEPGREEYVKETLAYYAIKSKARSSFWARRTSAVRYLISGFSSALIAGNSQGLSDSERLFANLNAVGFIALAAYQLLIPTEVELADEEIEKELAKYFLTPSVGMFSF